MENRQAKIAAVLSMMHGKRKMCSVCDIARATGIDTEVVKPLMVEIAMQPAKTDSVKKNISFTEKQIETMKQLWLDGKCMHDIAREIRRSYQSTRHKLWQMQRDGILQKRKDGF